MLLFVALLRAVIVPKGTYAALRLDALSTLLYVSNWHFILVNSNYFAQQNIAQQSLNASPLLHTWSLAVEEQFYLIWPLVVLGVMYFTKSLKVLLGLCVAAAVASALWMHAVYDHGLNTNRAFLGTDTRSQCLFIGCALAVALVLASQRSHEQGRLEKGELWRPKSSAGLAVCGALGIVGAVGAVVIWVAVTATSSFPYSGGFFLIGLSVAAVVLAVVAAPRSIVPRFLSLTPIRYVGRISYGLYIWHWPIFIWLNEQRVGVSGWELFVVRAGVTPFGVSVVFLPPRRAPDPHGHVRQPVAGLARRADRRGRGRGRAGGGDDDDGGHGGHPGHRHHRHDHDDAARGAGDGAAGPGAALRRLGRADPRARPVAAGRTGQVRLRPLRQGDPRLRRRRRARGPGAGERRQHAVGVRRVPVRADGGLVRPAVALRVAGGDGGDEAERRDAAGGAVRKW